MYIILVGLVINTCRPNVLVLVFLGVTSFCLVRTESYCVYIFPSQEIRGVFRVCKPQLRDDKYAVIRQSLYSYANGQLSHKQLVALCEVRNVVFV